MTHSIDFIDLFDWEQESDIHYYHMVNGAYYDEDDLQEEKKPAIIEVRTPKIIKNDNQTDKRSLFGIGKKRLQP